MSLQIKTAKILMDCPFTQKSETVFVQYVDDENFAALIKPTGCDSNYHKCQTCENCLEKSVKKFNASRNQ